MDAGQIAQILFELAITIILGVVGWSIKSTLGTIREDIQSNSDSIEKNDEKQTAAVQRLDEKQTAAVDKVRSELSDLKSDLPFVYVTREDYIRTMNNMDKQMTSMDGKLDRLLSKGSKED